MVPQIAMTALLFSLGLYWLAISLREWFMTVISDSLEHVFVHLHKCGGTSIEKAYIDRGHRLDTVLGGDKTGEALNLIWGRRFELHKHSTAQHLASALKKDWETYWTFSVVRHPQKVYESFYRWIDRIVRRYCERSNVSMVDWLSAAKASQLASRPEFMEYEGFGPYLNCSDFEDFVVRFSKRTSLGTYFERLGDGKKLLVDQVFRLEEADVIWKELSSRFGENIAPQHENKGSLIDDFEWTKTATDAVLTNHEIDCHMFGYEPLAH